MLVIVITDGYENASEIVTKERIKQMIRHQEEVYKWRFVYLGANVDAFAEGGDMGKPADRIASYQASGKGVLKLMKVMSESARSYRKHGVIDNLKREIGEDD